MQVLRKARAQLEQKQKRINATSSVTTEAEKVSLISKDLALCEERKRNIESELKLNPTKAEAVSLKNEWKTLLRGAKYMVEYPVDAVSILIDGASKSIKDAYHAVVDDPDIRAFWQHPGEIPNAARECCISIFNGVGQYCKDVYNNPGKLFDDVKSAASDHMSELYKNEPIEGTAKAGLEFFSILSGGRAAVKGSVENIARGGAQKVRFANTVKYRGYTDYANSFNTALKHRTVLAFEEAGILNENGKLTAKALKGSSEISLDGGMRNKDIQKVLCSDGSDISDWGKYKTQSVVLPTGEKRQIHFYMNKKTRRVDHETVDFKIKTPVLLGENLK